MVGFVAGPGSELLLGKPLLDPDALMGDLLLPFVSISVALILYEGGLTLRFRQLGTRRTNLGRARAAGWRGVALGLAAWGRAYGS